MSYFTDRDSAWLVHIKGLRLKISFRYRYHRNKHLNVVYKHTQISTTFMISLYIVCVNFQPSTYGLFNYFQKNRAISDLMKSFRPWLGGRWIYGLSWTPLTSDWLLWKSISSQPSSTWNIKGKGVDRYGASVFVAAHRYLKINPLPPIRLFFSISAKISIKFPRIRDMHKNLML